MAPLDDNIFHCSVVELSARLRRKEFSAAELARAVCDRLERLGPRYNALALSLRQQAVARAEEVDGELKRGRFRGPLQGVPFGAKDLLSFAGQPTTWGAKPFAGQVFDYNATVLRKLDRAGAVCAAKLSMVELAGGGGYRYASASLQGPGLNPWDRTRWSGGSSSGSGSAVAAGLVPFALGSETSGSIMTPCAYCGVTGLRPTYGLVSRFGAMALSWTMDKIGPMCRTVEDCGHVLQVIAGGDANDPSSAGKSFYFTPQYVRKFPDLRLGFAPSDFADWAESSTRPVFDKALADLRALGFQTVEVELPDLPYGLAAGAIIAAEGSAVFEPLIQSGQVDELADKRQIAGLKAGLEILAKDYLKAMRIRSQVQQEFRKLFTRVDFLVSPAVRDVASRLSEPLDGSARRPPESKQRGLRALGPGGNLAGLPALALPCGFVQGLPVALALVARPFHENLLLAIGKEYQARTDWHRRRPPAG